MGINGRLGSCRGIHAEDRNGRAAVPQIVTGSLQGGNGTQGHVVIVGNHQLHHIAGGFIVHTQNAAHVLPALLGRPADALIHQVLVSVGLVIELQGRLICLCQNGVGILHAVLGAGIGLGVVFLTLEQNIGDQAVMVQVESIVVGKDIPADHFPLKVAYHGIVSAYIGSPAVGRYHFLGNRAVEEHHRDPHALGHVHNGLGRILGADICHVDNQHRSTLGDGLLDLLGLGGLAALGIVVLVAHLGVIQRLVHSLPDTGQISILKGIPENGRFSGDFRRTLFSAGCQAEHHNSAQQYGNDFFHNNFLLDVHGRCRDLIRCVLF